jgi:hyaluronan synthase
VGDERRPERHCPIVSQGAGRANNASRSREKLGRSARSGRDRRSGKLGSRLERAAPAVTIRAMFSFVRDAWEALRSGGAPSLFMVFFAYVWALWAAKALAARRYRAPTSDPGPLATSVIVPVYDESAHLFRSVLASVVANRPTELIAVVDGGDSAIAAVAAEYCDRVLRIPKSGKRAAIDAGLRASDPVTDVVIVLDSDTIWAAGALQEMLRPFADPRVGGVTPRQAVFDADTNPVRRLANWMEDIRYHLTVPAQSVFGQVGCLAGRTIAYRRTAFEPAVARLVQQTVLGVPQHVGDDRVLTNELLRGGWRTVYQSRALVETDAPSDWRTFWRQQLRWGRSSQRETLLSLRWLWRRPVTFASFATDILTPFALYAVVGLAVAHALRGHGGPTGLPLAYELPLGYVGMLASIGVRQAAHVRRFPRDLVRLPLFVLQITFVMVPIRIAAFATMFHQGWATRGDRRERAVLRTAFRRPELGQESMTALSGESVP